MRFHRQKSFNQVWATGVLLAPAMLLLGATTASADDDAFVGYRYFKDRVSLKLDAGRVAVFADPDASRQTLAESLDVEGAAIELLVVSNAYVVSLSPVARSGVEMRTTLNELAASAVSMFFSPVLRDAFGDPVIVTRDVLVAFEPEVTDTVAREVLRTHIHADDKIVSWDSLDRGYRVHCATRNAFDVLTLANQLADLSQVTFAQPDMLTTSRGHDIPNDALFSDQWGLHNTGQSGGTTDMDMNVPEAYEYATGDSSVVIAILDNGMQLDHPDIGPVTGVDFTGNGTAGGPGNECDNHATLLAGTVRAIANNSIGVAGVAPGCTIVSVKYGVSTVPCNGSGTFLTSWLVDAIDWCGDNGVHITNNSNALNPQAAVTSKYQETYNAGVMHFASSGNFFSPLVSYPANLSTVVAVGAIDRTGTRANFSNYGTGMALMAPGVEIVTTDRSGADGQNPGDYDTVEGTSLSAPYAAAVAGLVLSVDPSLTPAEVEAILRDTALDLGAVGYDTQYGDGLVRANEAVIEAGARLPATTFTDCLNGPQVFTPPLTCSDLQFDLCDYDFDGDVDLRDYAQFVE